MKTTIKIIANFMFKILLLTLVTLITLLAIDFIVHLETSIILTFALANKRLFMQLLFVLSLIIGMVIVFKNWKES